MTDETSEQVTAERDALRAEVARLRAALPQWRQSSRDSHFWYLGDDMAWATESVWCGNNSGYPCAASSLSEAMRAAEAHCGLPVCEVVPWQ